MSVVRHLVGGAIPTMATSATVPEGVTVALEPVGTVPKGVTVALVPAALLRARARSSAGHVRSRCWARPYLY